MKTCQRSGTARGGEPTRRRILPVASFAVLMLLGFLLSFNVNAQDAGGRVINLVVRVPASSLDQAAGERVYIKMFARPLSRQAAGEGELELKVHAVQPIAAEKNDKARGFKVRVTLPSHVTKDKYALLAYVDSGNIVSESDEGAVDLTIKLGNVTLPQRIVSGGRGVARFPVEVSNEGNIAAADRQRIDIAIVGRPVGVLDDKQDVIIAKAENESISGLKPGDSRKVYLIAEFPGPLQVKTYHIRAVVDTSNAVIESDETNNTHQLRDTIGISEPSVDLIADIIAAKLPKGIVVGTSKSITVPVKITNGGNLAFSADQHISMRIIARPAKKAMDAKADIVLANKQLDSLEDLTPGKSQTIKIEASIPNNLPVDSYMLRAVIDAENLIKEANEANNTAMVLEPIKVMAMVVDLAGELVNAKAPKKVVGGTSETVTIPVKISNAGSVAYPAGQKMNVRMLMRPEDARDTKRDVILKKIDNRPISDLSPGRAFTLTLEGIIPSDMAVGTYKLLVQLDTTPKMQEADENNNLLIYPEPIGIEAPFIDLAAGIVSLRPPKAIVAGSETRLTIPIKVTNDGNIAVPSGKLIDITVAARPAGKGKDATNDVVLDTLKGQNISGLNPGTSQMFQARVGFPAGMTPDKYVLVAYVDSGATIKEPDRDNNYAATPVDHAIAIAKPRVDITAQIVNLQLPKTAIAGTGTKLTIPVKVTNNGNVPLLSDQTIDVRVFARPAKSIKSADKDVAMATLPGLSVANLAPGQSQTFNAAFAIPANLKPDKYAFSAWADAGNALVENDEKNNYTATDKGQVIDVAAPYVDLVADLVNPKLPASAIAGHGPAAVVTIKITNTGNVPVAPNQKIDIKHFARPAGAKDAGKDVVIGMQTGQSIADLAPGQAKQFSGSHVLPAGLAAGKYVLVSTIDSAGIVPESTRSNNTTVTDAAKAITIAKPFVDLAVELVDPKLPSSVIAGHSAAISLTAKVTNVGNVALPKDAVVQVRFAAHPNSAGDSAKSDVVVTTLGDQSIGTLGPNQSRQFAAKMALPASLKAGAYTAAVSIDAGKTVNESSSKNNRAVTPTASAVKVVAPFVDLKVELVDPKLPSSVIAGHSSTIPLIARVTNIGNVALPDDASLQVRFAAHPTSAGDSAAKDVVLATLADRKVGAMGPSQSRQFITQVEIPDSLQQGAYAAAVSIDAGKTVNESNSKNNRAVTPATNAIKVASPFVDLALELINPQLPKSSIAGYGPAANLAMNVINRGNIAVNDKQSIGLKIVVRPAANQNSDAKDVVVASLADQYVGGLAPGKSRRFETSMLMPANLPAGKYMFVAVADSAGAVRESTKKNNVANTAATSPMVVVAPFNDLAAGINLPQQTGQVVAGYGPAVGVSASLTNKGNVPFPSGLKVNVKFVAKPKTSGKSIALATLTERSVGSMAAGDSTEFASNLDFPAGSNPDEYTITASIDPVGTLVETTTENNSATSPTANPIKVIAPHIDLIGDIVNPKLPRQIVAGHGGSIQLPVRVSNAGNVAMSNDQRIDITIFARPVGTRGSADVKLATLESQTIAGMEPTHSKVFYANLSLPASLKSARYVLGARIDSGELIREANENNNAAVTADGLAIDVTAPFIDLAGHVELLGLPSGVISGSTQVTALIQVKNKGNITSSGKLSMDIVLVARPASRFKDDAQDIVLNTLTSEPVGGIGAGATRTYRAKLTLSPKVMPTDDYIIVARLDAGQSVSEGDETNNQAQLAEGTIRMGERFRVKNMPVPFESDGPQRYQITSLELAYPQDGKSYPDPNAIMQLKVAITNTYAGYVSQRSGEEVRKVRLSELSSVNARFYRSAVRQICALVAEHLEHNGIKGATVRPDPQQIDREGEDLRAAGSTSLRLVVEVQ